MITLTTADRLPLAELLDIWNRGFRGYFVDNTLDETRLARHIRWSAADLARSAVLLVDGKPAAFSLAAIQRRGGGLAAWIAGFGVAPEHRRKGLAGQLMREHCKMLDGAGVMETLLEVIDVNPARRVYSAAGFRETRTLLSLQGVPRAAQDAPPVEAARLELSALEELHASLHAQSPPVWRRELPALGRILAEQESAELLALPAESGHAAYALAMAGSERVALLDACASDAASAELLIRALADAFPRRIFRIIDEPEASPMIDALAGSGMATFLTQVEMVRTA